MENVAFIGDSQRREFIKKSAKMGVALGASAMLGNSMLFANSKDTGANLAKDSGKIPAFTLNNGVIIPPLALAHLN